MARLKEWCTSKVEQVERYQQRNLERLTDLATLANEAEKLKKELHDTKTELASLSQHGCGGLLTDAQKELSSLKLKLGEEAGLKATEMGGLQRQIKELTAERDVLQQEGTSKDGALEKSTAQLGAAKADNEAVKAICAEEHSSALAAVQKKTVTISDVVM